jgi:D-alanine--poly(phosphoribitol) ligase subunit 2
MVMALSEQKLIEYLTERKSLAGIDGDSPLFSNGSLDSVSQLELIMFIESEAGFQVSPMELTHENFDSVNRIISYVSTRGGMLQ